MKGNNYLIKLPLFQEKKRGLLCFGEAEKHIPFKIKRCFFIKGVPRGAKRGGHAHKKIKQALFCLSGSVKVILDDGRDKKEIILSKPNVGIFIDKMLWVDLVDFQRSTILCVLASDFYKEEDYIRDYHTFKKYKTL